MEILKFMDKWKYLATDKLLCYFTILILIAATEQQVNRYLRCGMKIGKDSVNTAGYQLPQIFRVMLAFADRAAKLTGFHLSGLF